MSVAHVDHCDAELGDPTLDCPGCRCEEALVRALDRELAPQPDDDDRLARAIAVAMLPVAPPPVAASTSTTATTAGIGWPWIAAGVATVVAAVAVLVGRPNDDDGSTSTVAQIEAETDEIATPIDPVPIELAPIVPPTAPGPIAPAPIASVGDAQAPTIVAPDAAEPVASPRPRTKPIPAAPVRETAAELFARATKARRAGDRSVAIALYRELQVDFADSREATVGTVALGRLLLDDDDGKAALAAFERYLQRAPDGTLAEEALVGKATALGRLGRARQEAGAWRALVERFPESAARGRAQSRLAAIEP